MYVCQVCERPINSASVKCPYCGAPQVPPEAIPESPRRKKKSPAKLATGIAVVVAGIWGVIWFALPLRIENPRPTAERAAIESLRSVQHQLAIFDNGAGFFPQSLESLGQSAQTAAQQALSGGYALRYTPEDTDPDGNPHRFALTATPRNYSYRSFYDDQTGVIRATKDNRAATALDPPVQTQ